LKRGAVVADLHCGSSFGLMPPTFTTYDGGTLVQNPGQEYMWRCWDDFTWRVSQFKPDFIIYNGDLIEGPQTKSKGYEVSLASEGDQVKAAIEIIQYMQKRLTHPCKHYFVRGTPYHVGAWGGVEEEIAKQCNGTPYLSVGTGKYCREVLWLTVEGVIIEAAHHISGTTGFYRLTGVDREAQWSAMSAKDATKGVPKSDVLIRSHVHFYGLGEHASKQIFTTPCWKLQDSYARKHSVHRFHPDIGGVMLEIDGEAKKRGNAPCRVIKELYSLPPVKLTSLE